MYNFPYDAPKRHTASLSKTACRENNHERVHASDADRLGDGCGRERSIAGEAGHGGRTSCQ